MSNRLGGFIAGQNISASIGTFTAVTSPTFTFGSTQGTPPVGQAVQFTTTGTLPTGLSTNTTYYVISTSTNTCQFSTTQNGSAVTFTNSSGSGTHTAVTQRAFNPYAGAPDTVEYLVVAGGGGGFSTGNSDTGAGGGGAGGLLTAANFNVAVGSALTVTVGAGGTGGLWTPSTVYPTNGSNSVFSSITATGGGFGGRYTAYDGQAGGSGGGASYTQTPGAGTSGQGNSGGFGSATGETAGGGGGAGSVGGSGIATATGPGGVGGAGLCSTITGQRVFYAGGGAGNSKNSTVIPGGAGGGGSAGNGSVGGAGVSGTGGGGGAGTGYYGGNGGSGIVIIRYPQINSAPALVTGSPQVSYSDNYQIYTFTSSGSIIF